MQHSGSFLLPNGFGKLEEERSYVLAFVNLNKKSSWNNFQSNLFSAIKNTPQVKFNPNYLLEESYSAAIKNSKWCDYIPMRLQNGYLYPSVPDTSYSTMESTLFTSMLNGKIVDLVYPSRRLGTSGELSIIKRLYVGNVYEISDDKKFVTLKIGDEFRNFSMNKVQRVSTFNSGTTGVVRHIRLILSPVDRGRVLVQWEHIDGESNPLLARPWGEEKTKELELETISTPAPPAERTQLKPAATLDELSALYNELITVQHLDIHGKELEKVFMNFKGFRLETPKGEVTIFGDGGVSIKGRLEQMLIVIHDSK